MGGKDGLVGQGVSTQMLMPGLMYSDMHGAPLGADMVRSWHLLWCLFCRCSAAKKFAGHFDQPEGQKVLQVNQRLVVCNIIFP